MLAYSPGLCEGMLHTPWQKTPIYRIVQQRIYNGGVKSCVFNFVQNTQIFHAIVGVLAVAVVYLLIWLKRLDKSMGYQTMDQKRFATHVAMASVTKPHFDVRFSASVVFFKRQAHDALRHPRLSAAFGAPKPSQGLDPAKRTHLVSAFVPLDVGPHFSTSIYALRLLHGFPLQLFLR